jgi:hypothetical protein
VLVEGVRLLGPSKWAEIKKMAVGGIGEVLTTRSAVDLKDKWRNLVSELGGKERGQVYGCGVGGCPHGRLT